MKAAKALEARKPRDPTTFVSLGMVHQARKDPASARAAFNKALELQPTFLPAASSLANLDLEEKRDPATARKRFESIIEANQKAGRGASNDAVYVSLARFLRRPTLPPRMYSVIPAGGQGKARVGRRPRGADADFLSMRETTAAVAAAREALEAIPNDTTIVANLATAYEAAGDHPQAMAMWNRLSAARPNSAQPLQRIARLHIAAKEFDKAVDFMQRAAKLAPSDLVVGHEFVAALALAGRNEDALKEARRYQTAQPKSPAGFEFEGDAHFDQKRWAEAERSYRSALKLQPAAGPLAVKLYLTLDGAGKAAEGRAFPSAGQQTIPRTPCS